jgi:opacity protein-like surface antigen
MTLKRITQFGMLAALVLVAATARAEDRKYRFEVFGGISAPIDKKFEISSPQAVRPISGEHHFVPGAFGGARIGIDGARHWGQDYSYSYGANASRIETRFGHFSFTNRFHQASSNVLFYPFGLKARAFFPYVTAGVGATFVVLNQRSIAEAIDPNRGGLGNLKSETIFAFNAGAGVRARLTDRFGVRVDARDYISRALRYGLPKNSSDPNAVVLPVSGAFHQLAGSVSVIIHF